MAKEKKEKIEKKTTIYFIPFLVGVLVVSAFFLGTRWTKLKESQDKVGEGKDSRSIEFEVKEGNEQDQESGVLGEEQSVELEQGAAAIKGDDEAPVTIVEFSDYLCAYCAEYAGINVVPNQPIDEGKTYQKIMGEYVSTGKVRYVFQDFAAHGQPAMERAAAARCAGEQGKYWEYHDALFQKIQEPVGADGLRAKLIDWAVSLGLNENDFSVCMDDEKTLQAVKGSYELGQKVGVRGTPSFFINGQELVGAQPFESFEAVIEAELAK